MKTFTEFLFEMTRQEAEKLLGLSSGWTDDELTLAFRRAASKNHPDRGGSVEAMQQINKANDLLKAAGATLRPREGVRPERSEIDEKIRSAGEFISADLQSRINVKAFEDHLAKVFGEPFTSEVKQWTRNSYYASHHVTMYYDFKNADKTKHFQFSVTADVFSFAMKPKSLGADLSMADSPYSVQIYGSNFSDNRKTKLSDVSWNKTGNSSKFTDPDTVFPPAKIAKKQTRKFSKRDFFAGLTALGAKFENNFEWAFVPLAEENKFLAMNRITFLGRGMWHIRGIYTSTKFSYKQHDSLNHTDFLEDEVSLEKIREISKAPYSKIPELVKNLKVRY